MTQSKHVYTATLLPDTPLKVHEDSPGSITFDAGTSPHVQGSLRLTGASVELLDAIDTRQSPPPRIQIDVDATFPGSTQARTFDLTVRGHDRDQDTGEPVVELASDEALLGDFRALEDDFTPLSHQDSLYDLVDYVLDTVIPGASLEPGDDVPVPALAESQNLVRNPRAGVGLTDWSVTWSVGGATPSQFGSGGPSYAPSYVGVQAGLGGASGAYIYLDENAISLTPGKLYVLSCAVRAHATRQMSLDAILYDASGNIVAFATPDTAMPASSWVRLSTSFYAVTNATKLRPRVTPVGGLAGAEYVDVTAWRLSESTGDAAADELYFDGDTTDTSEYQYDWANGAHESVSSRAVIIDAATPEGLTWMAGQSAIEFLQPIVQRFGRRLVCDETRAWTLRTAGYVADGSTTVRFAVNMTKGRERVSRDLDIWCDAAIVIYTWTDSSGVQRKRVDSYSSVAEPTFVRRIEKSTAYPGPGFAQYVVERAQGRGREVSASKVADWRTTAEQLASIRLSGSPEQVGTIQRLEFDLSNDEMSLTARTQELDPDAWLLDDADIDWLDTDPDEPWEA